jgi:hypothetical protein
MRLSSLTYLAFETNALLDARPRFTAHPTTGV